MFLLLLVRSPLHMIIRSVVDHHRACAFPDSSKLLEHTLLLTCAVSTSVPRSRALPEVLRAALMH